MQRTEQAALLMTNFAQRTGVSSVRPPQRYLWTDSFAVCNLIGLQQATGDAHYGELAVRLIEQVHHTLGRHRAGSMRSGWISGLHQKEGQLHPTEGGLRIGKPLDERPKGAAVDERLEWERDGQYFHYLTKWMHALDQAGRATGDAQLRTWARELSVTAHRKFVWQPEGGRRPRMYWKMSIDLSRPQIASMGQHDPLDGLVTALQLGLSEQADAYAAMVDPESLATADPLGIGGLLVDACRLQQLARLGGVPQHAEWLDRLMDAALLGLAHYRDQPDLRAPASERLAFRELGLAIGLAAAPLMGKGPALAGYEDIRRDIEEFWLREENRQGGTWQAHADINDVMLATALAPEGFLVLT